MYFIGRVLNQPGNFAPLELRKENLALEERGWEESPSGEL